MDDVETRELRYFVTVAEELHFGRAAERLGIAQPPLSRAIRRLAHRMGVTLLERTSRSARLTAAGEVLLAEGRAALQAVAAATRRTQRAGRPQQRLILVVKPGSDAGMLPRILAEYESRPDALPVEFVFTIRERSAMLRDGRADVGLLHSPQNDLRGLHAGRSAGCAADPGALRASSTGLARRRVHGRPGRRDHAALARGGGRVGRTAAWCTGRCPTHRRPPSWSPGRSRAGPGRSPRSSPPLVPPRPGSRKSYVVLRLRMGYRLGNFTGTASPGETLTARRRGRAG
jgi:DNA-binding transcriptional LysR family regulator